MFVLQLLTVLLLFLSSGKAQSPSHQTWDVLLKKHVKPDGRVDYRGFIRDSLLLNRYLSDLQIHPPEKSWTLNETQAFWINAYNAFTIQLVIRNHPVKNIKEIGGRLPFVNSSWDIRFIRIGPETMDLNQIEHGILRKQFQDPRYHFALVCAARSCPALRREAYSALRLEEQLDDQCRRFLGDPSKNRISRDRAQLSQLFQWYRADFDPIGGWMAFINRYSKQKISDKTAIRYLDYDWSLNGL